MNLFKKIRRDHWSPAGAATGNSQKKNLANGGNKQIINKQTNETIR